MQKTVINKKENPGASAATPFFKKEKSSSFFDGGESAFFKNSHATNVQRKCAHCEQEEKKQHKEENEEEQGKEIQRKPIFESGDDDIIQRQPNPPANPPADAGAPPPVVPPIGTCPAYDANEVNRSRTAAGWLTQDVTEHTTNQLLFADFGNNHSNVKPSALTEVVWNIWKTTFLTDGSYRIQIAGYSDCSGNERVNTSIRQARALNMERAFGSGIAPKLSFRGMQGLGQFVVGNDTPENRARNRSVIIEHKRGFFFEREAMESANAADTAIRAALAELSSSTMPRERNVPAFIAARGITIEPLTPRHEGTVATPTINFFPGTNYAQTFTLPAAVRFHIYDSNAKIAVQGRNMPDITAMATSAQIKERIVQAVTEVANLAAAGPVAAATTFEQYKAQFNAWWFVDPYVMMTREFNPALDSFGPRTVRAREIFKKIYAENAAVKNAYDNNTDTIKEKIDTYNFPEGANLINSPRLQALRDVFTTNAPPINNANYPAFKTAVEAASAPLDSEDRQAVVESNEWQRLINQYLSEELKRQEIRRVINTPPVAPALPPPPAPAPAAGGGPMARAFLNHIRIDGPVAPVAANQTTEMVTLTPVSDRPCPPGLTLNTHFTVTPAARVMGTNISPEEPWAVGDASGNSHDAEISNIGNVLMNAHLDITNLPPGIVAPVVGDLQFQVNDNRMANLLAHWRPEVSYNKPGGGSAWVSGGGTARYTGGGQQFNISAWLPVGTVNPGLPISVVSRLKLGGVVVQNNTAAPVAFPNNQRSSTPILFNVSAPATVPPAGDAYDVEIDLVDNTGAVLGTKNVAFPVLTENVFTQADAIRNATEDNAFFHDNSATGLLGLMTARGGLASRVAAAVNTADADGGIVVLPLTARHDSADYIRRTTGRVDPSKTAYFVGLDYTHSKIDVGAVGFYTRLFPALGSKVIILNRTHDVATNAKRSDDSLIDSLVHEAIHAMDVRPNRDTDIERYKTEFRAYWTEGAYGPPNQPLCGPGAGANCHNAAFDSTLQPPGPKSPRARAIFRHLYNDRSAYGFVKDGYDGNPDFRVQVDNYTYPDGINLLASVRLERLRAIIEAYAGADFATLRTQVRQYMALAAPAPAGGVMDADEKAQIRSSRAWRDLVERKVTVAADQLTLKGDLGIPVAP